ncbi:MAG: hypothetical protein MJ246_02115 [Clostridia bacterium]|nr:hypothetical protein [Clostridia bacterium]
MLGTNDAAGKTVVPNLEFNYLSTSGPIAVYDGIGYYEEDYVWCDDDDNPSTPEVIAKFDISLDKTGDV